MHVPGTIVPIPYAIEMAQSSVTAPLPPPSELQRTGEEWNSRRLKELRSITCDEERLVRAVAAFLVVTEQSTEGVGGRRTTRPTV